MVMTKKRIGISLRIVKEQKYNEIRDALSHDWPILITRLGFHPILIPNVLEDIESFLSESKLDGIILSGGDNIGDFQIRDDTEKTIVNYAIKKEVPIFGVCRGMQLLNEHFGGTLIKTNTDVHVANPHKIEIIKNDFSSFLDDEMEVNSFHRNIIKKNNLGEKLEIFANSEFDDTVEGFYHKKLPIVGVMWHPERTYNDKSFLLINDVFRE